MKVLFSFFMLLSFSVMAKDLVTTVSSRHLLIVVTAENYMNTTRVTALEGSDQRQSSALYVEVYLNADAPCNKLNGAQKYLWNYLLGHDLELNYYTGMGHLKMTEPARACVYGQNNELLEEISFETRRWED